MRAHIVLAHPERQSFNGTLADASQRALVNAGWDVSMSDLYGDGFDPREGARHYESRADTGRFHAQTEQRFNADQGSLPSDVQREMDQLLESDLLVVHFPLWWFGMPAILKGWMDRVFVYGAMYRSQARYDQGVCAGKRMLACVTTGASADSCAADGREGDTRMHLWPALFPFRYLGYDVLSPAVFHGIGGVSFVENEESAVDVVESYVDRWSGALVGLDDWPLIPYNADGDFDERKRLHPEAPAHSPFISHVESPTWPVPPIAAG